MRKFQEMCQEEFEKIELMARGGQKIVYDGVHNSYGETVIKLYFQLNDPRSIREIQIEKGLNLSMVPKIYETGTISALRNSRCSRCWSGMGNTVTKAKLSII